MKKHLKDYFVPHAGNDYKPHSLQKAAVMGMGLMILLSFALTNLQSVVWVSSDWLVSSILPAVIVDLTNEERQDDALLGLRRSPTLDLAAKQKAEHMAKNEYFAHYSPDGVSPWHWFDVAGYHYVHAGENLAVHFTDSSDVVSAWMNSPAHRANIMNGKYTEIGVGTAEGRYEGFRTIYVVQLFGTPEAAVANSVVSATDKTAAPVVAAALPSAPGAAAVLSESIDVSSNEITEVGNAPVTDIVRSEDGMSIFSDLMTTSTGGIPVDIEPDAVIEPEIKSNTSWVGSLLTSPHLVLKLLYSLIGAFVVTALMLSVVIESRRRQPVQVAYALVLLALMFGLHQVHVLLSGGALIV